jgi:hypothetical protein
MLGASSVKYYGSDPICFTRGHRTDGEDKACTARYNLRFFALPP